MTERQLAPEGSVAVPAAGVDAGRPLQELGWRLLNVVQGIATGVWSVVWISVAILLRLVTGGSRAPLWLARKVWSPFLLWGAGATLDVRGRELLESGGPYLFVTNHASQLDIPVLFVVLDFPIAFIVKAELAKVPFLGAYLKATEMVFLPRSERTRSVARLGRAVEHLERGRPVVAFPEGTRSRDGRLRPFKTGVFLPALEAGVAVVPLAMRGTAAVLPADGFKVRPGIVRVDVGEPIPTAGLGRDDRHDLARRCRAAVEALLARP